MACTSVPTSLWHFCPHYFIGWTRKTVRCTQRCVVENIEFSGATVPDQNGAGIRQQGDNLTVRHCYFHGNEDGILGGGGVASEVLIEYSEYQEFHLALLLQPRSAYRP